MLLFLERPQQEVLDRKELMNNKKKPSLFLRQALAEDADGLRQLKRYRQHLALKQVSVAAGLEPPWPEGLSERFRAMIVVRNSKEVVAYARLGYAPDLPQAQALMHHQLIDRLHAPMLRVLNQVMAPSNTAARVLLHNANLLLASRLRACLVRESFQQSEKDTLILPILDLISPQEHWIVADVVPADDQVAIGVAVVPPDAVASGVDRVRAMQEPGEPGEVVWEGEEPFIDLRVH